MFTKGYDEREGQICILTADDLQLVEAMQVQTAQSNKQDPLGWLYLSPDGAQLLVSSYSGILRVYQITEADKPEFDGGDLANLGHVAFAEDF